MKRILFALILFTSCNPKVKIVEQEKQIKDSIRIYKMFAGSLDILRDLHPDSSHTSIDSEQMRYKYRIYHLQNKYDSLEMELKKY